MPQQPERQDWFAYSMDLGIPSSLAHRVYERKGIDALRKLCNLVASGQVTLADALIEVDPPEDATVSTPEEDHGSGDQ